MASWTDAILGQLTNPGTGTSTAEEALGIPLALFGSYELARGAPIGAPAALLGGGLSALGYQGYQSAADRESLVRGYKAYQPYFDYKKVPADQFAGMDPEIQKQMVKAASEWSPNVGVFRNIVKSDPTSEQAKLITMFGGPEAAADAGVSAKSMFEKMATAGAGPKPFMNEGLGDTLLRMGIDPAKATNAQKEAAARQQQADVVEQRRQERQNASDIAAANRPPREGSFTPLYDTSGNIIGRWDSHSGTPTTFPHPLNAGTKTPGKTPELKMLPSIEGERFAIDPSTGLANAIGPVAAPKTGLGTIWSGTGAPKPDRVMMAAVRYTRANGQPVVEKPGRDGKTLYLTQKDSKWFVLTSDATWKEVGK